MNIYPLKEKSDFIPVLAQWIFEEWGYDLNVSCPRVIEDFLHNELLYGPNSLHQTFVYVMGGHPVGMVKLIPEDMHHRSDKGPWLQYLYVIPELRGMGIGSELINHTEGFCRKQHVDRLYLITPNSPDYYKSLRWKALRTNDYGGRHETLMGRDLH